MSEAVERVRLGYEAFNRGDLDAALAGLHPDVEWSVLAFLPEAEVYRGPDGVRAFWEMWFENFEEFQIEVEEIVDVGDRILALIAISGSGRGSGVDVQTPTFAQIWTYEEGKVTRVEMLIKEDALASLGLREEDLKEPRR